MASPKAEAPTKRCDNFHVPKALAMKLGAQNSRRLSSTPCAQSRAHLESETLLPR